MVQMMPVEKELFEEVPCDQISAPLTAEGKPEGQS